MQDHLPKTCSEAAEDKVLDVQHAVEEAMSSLFLFWASQTLTETAFLAKALVRNCPKCQRQFLKVRVTVYLDSGSIINAFVGKWVQQDDMHKLWDIVVLYLPQENQWI